MGEISKIQWTESTWNPWHGCKKVSDGCKFCYMYRDKERYNQDPKTVLRSKTNFFAPLKWKEPKLIFTCSWSDFFIEEADWWRQEAWEVIKATPWHTYQILTKRPERIKQCLPADWGSGYDNVWLGVSVENEEAALKRIEPLIEIPAKIRFLSVEPLLGPVSFRWKYIPKIKRRNIYINLKGEEEDNGSVVDHFESLLHIHWVIVGGESGNGNKPNDPEAKYGYRKCELKWIEDVVSECKENNVPVFVKQLGTHLSKGLKLKDRHGGDIKEFPLNLQHEEMPKIWTERVT